MSLIPVTVAQLSIAQISPTDVSFVLLLRGVDDERTLPIFIAATEAQSISIKLHDKAFPRPLTHDLMKDVMDRNACELERVEVCDLVNNTFHAKLVLSAAGDVEELDSRPSDAIALALRCAAPIFVDEDVMDRAGVIVEDHEGGKEEVAQRVHEEQLSPLERLKQGLEASIEEERYEDAAKLRDEIRTLEENQQAN